MSSSSSLENAVRSYSRSPWPAWSLASIFLASSVLPPKYFPKLPPFPQRLGFSIIMYGAGYVISTGDSLNGSGISTAWSLTYLFWNGRRSFTTLRSPLSIFLAGATALSTGLYGTEYFILGDTDSKQDA
ncbi:hypothetical protein ACEPAH_5313 [Sanghuangporus vaninii]